jgi:hypothetical protein
MNYGPSHVYNIDKTPIKFYPLKMSKKVFSLLIPFILCALLIPTLKEKCYGNSETALLAANNILPQTEKKPKYDEYMNTIMQRDNTSPLGLKDNPELRKYLNQPAIKWAIRSGRRHILN